MAIPAIAQAQSLIQVMSDDIGQRRPSGCPSKWCACYLEQALEEAGLPVHGTYRARDFASYGEPAEKISVGTIMVMRNHVGVVSGNCPDGRVQIVSGNYSNKVAPGCYAPSKAIAWRNPPKGGGSGSGRTLMDLIAQQ